ncbi:GTPase [Streptomyces agglomeratus]|uniref:GTPase n=1 Tax=Streptomyces agglomeratus TaxID=285458 RepID=UPI00159F1F05|nr:GTPase [Streptomyces agglomeratus]
MLDILPEPARIRVQEEISQLLAMLQERRNPRVMMVGRRGAGKSALTNALLGAQVRKTGVGATTGKAQWEVCSVAGREIELLDTRGVQEGSKPVEDDPAASAEESLLTAVRDKCPDIILFLVKATEVDSAITGDLAALELVHREACRVHKTEVKVVPVLTHCDELPPGDVRFPPHDSEDEEKMENVRRACMILARHLKASTYLSANVACEAVPTSALMIFDDAGNINHRRDYRWNIDTLALRMQEILPDAAQLAFVRLTQFRVVQKRAARTVVGMVAAVCGVIGIQPIPFADLPFIAALQAVMIVVIAYISGKEISLASARELLTGLGVNVGAGLAFREISRALVKLLPMAGNVVSGAVATAGTKALGEAAILYFIDKKPLSAARRRFESGD